VASGQKRGIAVEICEMNHVSGKALPRGISLARLPLAL